MKYFFCLFICLINVVSIPTNANEKPNEEPFVNPGFKIITLQHQDFHSYTNALNGFEKGLKGSALSDNISIEHFNAHNDMNELKKKLVQIKQQHNFQLIFTMGTQSTKMAVETIKKIPIVFTVVSSPIDSGIVSNWKSSGSNVTGIGAPNQTLKSIEQIYELSGFTSIGLTYLVGSPSHESVVGQIKAMCKKNGIKFIYDGFPLRNDAGERLSEEEIREKLKQSLDYILPQVDVIYIQASGTYNNNFEIFRNKLKTYRVPSMGEPIYIKKGIIAGIGVDHHAFGKQAADYAVQILNGTPPAELPMDVGTKFSILVNLEAAERVQLRPHLLLPIMSSADAIYTTLSE